MYYVYFMFTYIYNEHERDSWLIIKKSLYASLKAVAPGGEKWNYGGRGDTPLSITWHLVRVVTSPNTSQTWVQIRL